MSGVLSDAEVLAILEDIGNAGESLLANPEHELGKVAASHRALRQQRDTLREALRGLAGAYGVEFRKEGYVMLRVEEAALRRVDAALAQCDAQEGVK